MKSYFNEEQINVTLSQKPSSTTPVSIENKPYLTTAATVVAATKTQEHYLFKDKEARIKRDREFAATKAEILNLQKESQIKGDRMIALTPTTPTITLYSSNQQKEPLKHSNFLNLSLLGSQKATPLADAAREVTSQQFKLS